MKPIECDCVLLAAGLSSRSSEHKLLREIDGEPLVARSVRNAAVCRRVILVTGHQADAVLTAALASGVSSSKLTPVHNADFENGMFSSVQAGLREVSSRWFFVAPADLPDLHAGIFGDLAARSGDGRRSSEHESGAAAFVPVWNGRRGHPVLIHQSVIDHALSLRSDEGPMRRVLSRFPVEVVETHREEVVLDLDSDEDFERYRSKIADQSESP